jgi:hypothetical protein
MLPLQNCEPGKVMSHGLPNSNLIRERVVILTDQDLIEGTICYVEGIRLSDALNSETAHLARPHLPLVDATVSNRNTGEVVLRSRFLLVARNKIIVLLPKSEFCNGDPPWSPDRKEVNGSHNGHGRGERAARRDDHLPALISQLADPDEVARRYAAEGLARLGPRAMSAVPALLERLKDCDELVRGQCAEALGNIGRRSREVITALRSLLKDRNEFVRRMAAGALGDCGAHASSAVADLIETLKAEEEFVRRSAATALGQIGALAGQAVPALHAALRDPDVIVRHSASVALNKIVGAGANNNAGQAAAAPER